MKRSRTERREARRARSRLIYATAIVGLVAIAAGITIVAWPSGDGVAVSNTVPDAGDSDATTTAGTIGATESVDVSTTAAQAHATPVEVPDVSGMLLDEAEMILRYAGLTVETAPGARGADIDPDAETSLRVVACDPVAGALVESGSTVTLSVEAVESTFRSPHHIVCIDPGHQARSNPDREPIGPGATETKERVRGGTTGVSTRIPEYETVLEISLLLKAELEERGVEVVMTRESNDVDISNAERAQVANQAGADLFVRVHADGAVDEDTHGVSVLYPSGNSWVAPIEEPSLEAADAVRGALVAATGAADGGLAPRSDITGFNWAKVPAILVECGFLTNPIEDKLLNSEDYQQKVAAGIAEGIMAFLAE